jgi:D-arabinose 1-dehydrogenase-like Zn-dependent alcohol dehydrogenase
MSELIDGLGPNGQLIVVGVAFDPIEVTPVQLMSGNRIIQGWATGTPADAEDTLRFAELTGVRPMIDTDPLGKAALDEASLPMAPFDRTLAGESCPCGPSPSPTRYCTRSYP